ncbi:GNAT family N-acetyltransferase [Anaerosporobacter faecicola]|uniref:GNAT family N-acetyltransferase n=1 Tax=Anaerosporobacter faecicola TaxID=2718714 RepID=UPI00143A1B74|nr:GNAT family N-acetyltransferase [Anaerosporobacter faecicola]
MIQFATKAMIGQLKKIWSICFGDEDSYINFFFQEYFSEQTTLVYLEEEQPVSMLTLMPAYVWELMGKKKKSYYVYAVATLPEYRGKQYSSKLLEYANSWSDFATFLEPATEELILFYKKNGYEPCLYKQSYRMTREEVTRSIQVQEELQVAQVSRKQSLQLVADLSIQELTEQDAACYKRIRDQALGRPGYVEWGTELLAYAIKENAFTGGKTYLIDNMYIAMVREYEGVLYVREHTMPRERLFACIEQISKSRSWDFCQITEPFSYEKEDLQKQVILSNFKIPYKEGYFSLAFE